VSLCLFISQINGCTVSDIGWLLDNQIRKMANTIDFANCATDRGKAIEKLFNFL
jgi:hypothetical protein